jgi:ribosomal subunit interface protein
VFTQDLDFGQRLGVFLSMQISISGKNMDTGLAFQAHAELSLNNVVEKYFNNAVSGHVTLEKADSGFTVKTRVALSRRMELESTGPAPDAHSALDAAIQHAEKRLRRHKRRLKNHRGALTNLEEDDIDVAPMAVYAGASQLPDASSDEDDLLPIVAELSYDIEVLTVDQAVMRLELGGLTMLMFRNARHFGLNVVHLRDDGSIGWIDPRGSRHLANPNNASIER